MSGVKVEHVKMDTNGPQNGPKVDEKKAPGDGVVKFHGGQGGGGGHNNNQGFGGRGGRGGHRGGGGNRNNNQRGPRGPGGPQQHQNQNQKKDLMSIETGMSDNKQGGQQGGGGQQRRPPFQRNQDRGNQEDRFAERIATISGPTIELPPIDTNEKKFAGRCRLYLGNLTNDITKEEIEELFAPFGETSELFINSEKMFAFIRVDFRANAEKAKRELDGQVRKGRPLRVRFAPHSAAVKVKNLNQFVTNELLEWAFQVFGEIERAIVIADERGKSTGEGIVEFARKPGAMQALRRCTEGCYFITGTLRPVIVEPYEFLDDVDGYNEKSLFKKSAEFYKERDVGPRFGNPGSFEAEYGQRWKSLSDLYKQKEEALKREMKLEEEKLEAQMEYARYEHETEMLRAQLRQREQDKERQKREWELKERAADEAKRNEEEMLRRQSDEMQMRLKRQEEDVRRRQNESSLFMQAHQLTSLLEQQEQALGSPFDSRASGGQGNLPSVGGDHALIAAACLLSSLERTADLKDDPKAFLDSFDGRQRQQQPRNNDNRGGTRWGGPPDRRGLAPGPEDYQNKRRRY